jgi:L-threonylcarbamoyladenylate synthase
MLIIKKPNNKILKEVAKQLRAGAVVVYPTDTAYALGCDATNAKAVAHIFKIKGRDAKKAFPMVVADIKMAKKFFLFATCHVPFAKRYWPGPLSIIVKAKKGIAKKALSKGTAAVRVPDSAIARILSKHLGRPLVATSANISRQPTCYSVKAYLAQIGRNHAPRATRHMPDIILDAGALRRRAPSTIVKIDENGRVEVLRKGPIKFVPK